MLEKEFRNEDEDGPKRKPISLILVTILNIITLLTTIILVITHQRHADKSLAGYAIDRNRLLKQTSYYCKPNSFPRSEYWLAIFLFNAA